MLLAEPNHWAKALACALAASGAAQSWAGGAAYTLIDLGIAPGLNASAGVDINMSGQVVMGSWDNLGDDTNNTAEFWDDLNNDGVVDAGERIDMGWLGGADTLVYGMNNLGVAVGRAIDGMDDSVAFRWTLAGGLTVMQSLPGNASSAVGVNNHGVSVGQSRTLPLPNSASRLHAVMWDAAGNLTEITPSASSFHENAVRINDAGHILGLTNPSSPWIIRDSVRYGLGGGSSRFGSDLDEAGDAVGYARVGSIWQACRWTWANPGYTHAPLASLSGFDDSHAYGVNGSLDIVGAVNDPERRAVIWPGGGPPVDLNTLIEPGSGWVLREARKINDDGSIVGFGDKDGVEFRAFLLVPSALADTDGDGLLDDWEKNGVPYDDGMGGEARFMLPGADPLHKDLYVEVDAMTGLSFPADAADRVVFAFETAPLQNPDGAEGVTLHILRDETTLPFVAVWQTNGCWPLDFDTYRTNHFGTAAQRASPNAAALLEAKAKAYRYCIVANNFGPDAIGGCGQTPGDNFVITHYANDIDAAAVFMHELGHNLGLRHGGGDGVNGKPNYPSIMNYANSYQYPWNQAFWRLDFSRHGADVFPTLDESALNELIGVGALNGFYDGYMMPFGVNVTEGMNTVRKVRFLNLNGTATDFGDTAGNGFQDGSFDESVSQDLNYVVMPPNGISLPSSPSAGDTLDPFDDWSKVGSSLPLASTLGLRGVEPEYPDDELTTDAIEWISQNFPLPPPECPGDVDGDGFIGFADLNAVLADFNEFGPQFPGDIDRDGAVDFADLNIVISAFNTTCDPCPVSKGC